MTCEVESRSRNFLVVVALAHYCGVIHCDLKASIRQADQAIVSHWHRQKKKKKKNSPKFWIWVTYNTIGYSVNLSDLENEKMLLHNRVESSRSYLARRIHQVDREKLSTIRVITTWLVKNSLMSSFQPSFGIHPFFDIRFVGNSHLYAPRMEFGRKHTYFYGEYREFKSFVWWLPIGIAFSSTPVNVADPLLWDVVRSFEIGFLRGTYVRVPLLTWRFLCESEWRLPASTPVEVPMRRVGPEILSKFSIIMTLSWSQISVALVSYTIVPLVVHHITNEFLQSYHHHWLHQLLLD